MGKKQVVQPNWVGKGAKFMFSFTSRAKPGKHFLVETGDEDGQLENGSVLQQGSTKGNDYAGEFLFFTKPLLFIFLFKFTGNRRSARKEKSGKNQTVSDFAKTR